MPVSCQILMYIFCKHFIRISVSINQKGFEKKLPNIQDKKILKSSLEEYLLPKITLIVVFWEITRDSKTLEEYPPNAKITYCNRDCTHRKICGTAVLLRQKLS